MFPQSGAVESLRDRGEIGRQREDPLALRLERAGASHGESLRGLLFAERRDLCANASSCPAASSRVTVPSEIAATSLSRLAVTLASDRAVSAFLGSRNGQAYRRALSARSKAGKTGGIDFDNLEKLADALEINAALLIRHEPANRRGKG